VRQQALRERCRHPAGGFLGFDREEIERSLVERFDRQVKRAPGRLAVKTVTARLTYGELDLAANRIAQSILALRDAGPEPVALLLPKDAWLVASVVGVLKAGACFVVLDPGLPRARLSHLLEDSGAGILLTDTEHMPHAAALRSARCMNVQDLDHGVGDSSPALSIRPDDLAYILYTSGSTGRPKGVMESHRNVLHYIMTETNDLHLCPDDRLTFIASQGRDIFRALLNGAAVYPRDLAREGFAGLTRLLVDEEITIYNSVASAFRQFAVTLTREQFPHLRLVKLMGEAVYPSDVALFRQHFPATCVFVNWYGPNETGLLCHYLVDADTPILGATVPVGYAVSDKTLMVVGGDGAPVNVGEVGEIVVRSPYLSPGYWRQPDLTAAAFVPASPDGVERVYRTGDLGTMDADGCLTLAGREDQQVKVRGFRVEIAEVETALLAVAGVREAAVVAHEDSGEGKRLVAYLVATGTPAPTVRGLRAALGDRLPDYMIPSAFMLLDRLPVIGIGKVDRRALALQNPGRPALASPHVAPRTPIEAELCRLWADVLRIDRVGVDDDFLELGGHSLLASQIAARVRERFHVEIAPRALLVAPTVAEMAVTILRHQAEALDPAELARWLSAAERPPEKLA
jgi:amino acid adenylation domain-containing protein